MHEQSIIDAIINSVDTSHYIVKTISLVCRKETLTSNLQKDIDVGKRDFNILERSLSRLPFYESLDTIKIKVDGKSIEDVAEEIMRI